MRICGVGLITKYGSACAFAHGYGPLLFAAVNRFSQEIDKHLWGWADNKVTDQHMHSRTYDFFFIITIFIIYINLNQNSICSRSLLQ